MKVRTIDTVPYYAAIDGGCVFCVGAVSQEKDVQTYGIHDDSNKKIMSVYSFPFSIPQNLCVGISVRNWRRNG